MAPGTSVGGSAIAIERRRIRVRGIVQGVGFRPFVYRLAEEEQLAGWVLNDTLGVLAEVEGAPDNVRRFERRIKDDAPPMARVMSVEGESVAPTGERGFAIRRSESTDAKTTLVSPDVATCGDCLRELFDPRDRRYRYPFINCTNCGPRFTIIRDVPYDRPKTTMSAFAMCEECRREYEDPRDRRFHAQPDACAKCGPRAWLADAKGAELAGEDVFRHAAKLLREGACVAVKGLGGFHLACDATSEAAVARMRRRKSREEKPFAAMARDLDVARRLAGLSDEDARLLESPERPIVLLARRADSPLAASVAPRSKYVGVMLPYTPVHHLLLAEGLDVLVMTSGNVSDEPIARTNEEAVARLGGIADYFLMHDREIYASCDDSVVRRDAGGLRMMRRSRGYVPGPVPLEDGPVILAVGAELKSAVAITRGSFCYLSRHVGDVKNVETNEYFERTVEHLATILAVTPEIVAHDPHPDYHSTRYAIEVAKKIGAKLVAVQHHHAHVAGGMAEHGLEGKVIGVALDGTGYGTDGRIWGGEFLVADRVSFARAGHFEYLPLPGGDRAVKEPWRTAFSALVRAFGDDWRTLDVGIVARRDRQELEVVARMIARGVNSPLSSGAGRVFDAVSALVGVCDLETYEGQPAIELEAAAEEGIDHAYPVDVAREEKSLVVGFAPTYRAIVADLRAKAPVGVISARFHNAVVAAVVDVVIRISRETSLKRVCLSGGVFQNRYLSDRVAPRLRALGLEVYEPSVIPPNDGGIALGQAAVARALSSTLL